MNKLARAALITTSAAALLAFALVRTSSAKPPPSSSGHATSYDHAAIIGYASDRAGNLTSLRIRSLGAEINVPTCGAKLADHPELVVPPQNGRTIEVKVDASNCFAGVNIFQ